MFVIVMVKSRARSVQRAGDGRLGAEHDEETPNVSAATTSAMALDAITDFVLLNRSGFIYSSFSL